MSRPADTSSPWASKPSTRSRAAQGLADLSEVVIAEHIDNGAGRCRGCHQRTGRSVLWPCTFVRLGQLAERIVRGDRGEQ